MVEGRTLKVLLCVGLITWPKPLESIESKDGAYVDESAWFHGDACQH